MFSRHAIRMLRENWPNAVMLAQELFAIFSQDDLPLQHSGPITLVKDPDSQLPPIQLKGFSPDDPIFDFQDGQGESTAQLSTNDLTGETTEPDTGLTNNGSSSTTTTGGGGGFPGTIASGTGDTYTVTLTTGETITAKCLQISEGETIPADTGVVCVQDSAGAYWFQVAVWL